MIGKIDNNQYPTDEEILQPDRSRIIEQFDLLTHHLKKHLKNKQKLLKRKGKKQVEAYNL